MNKRDPTVSTAVGLSIYTPHYYAIKPKESTRFF
jgi:hypothetical protein